MMRSRLLLTGLSIVTTLVAPMTAHAASYLTPEEVLLQDAFLNSFTPPPTTRETTMRRDMQQETSAERRAREQAEYFAAQRPAAPEENTHASADGGVAASDDVTKLLEDLQASLDALSADKQSPESQRDQRILDRIAANQDTLRGAADGKGVVEGKGKGLTDSGPGLIAALGVLLAAAGWTLLRVRADGFVKAEALEVPKN